MSKQKSTLEESVFELVQFDSKTHDKDCGVTITRDYGNCDCNKTELMSKLLALIESEKKVAIYDLHASIMRNELTLGGESDQAFNYGRIHSWIDKNVERASL